MLPQFRPNQGGVPRWRFCQVASAGISIHNCEGLAEHVAAIDLNQALEAFVLACTFCHDVHGKVYTEEASKCPARSNAHDVFMRCGDT